MPGWEEGSYSTAGLEYLELEAVKEPPRRPGTDKEDAAEGWVERGALVGYSGLPMMMLDSSFEYG